MKRPYIVFRPYCYPVRVLAMAKDNASAVKKVSHKYGFAKGTTARLIGPGEMFAF